MRTIKTNEGINIPREKKKDKDKVVFLNGGGDASVGVHIKKIAIWRSMVIF